MLQITLISKIYIVNCFKIFTILKWLSSLLITKTLTANPQHEFFVYCFYINIYSIYLLNVAFSLLSRWADRPFNWVVITKYLSGHVISNHCQLVVEHVDKPYMSVVPLLSDNHLYLQGVIIMYLESSGRSISKRAFWINLNFDQIIFLADSLSAFRIILIVYAYIFVDNIHATKIDSAILVMCTMLNV